MATWPASLPQRLESEGFSIEAPEGALRSGVSAGRAFQRSRYTAVPEMFSGKIWVTKDQYITLRDFWKTTLGNGALKFDWVHPITEESAEVRFIADEPFKVTARSGIYFSVSMNMEVL